MCLGKLQFNILDWDFIFHYQVFEKLSSVILRIFEWRRNFCQPSVALGQETAVMSHTNLLPTPQMNKLWKGIWFCVHSILCVCHVFALILLLVPSMMVLLCYCHGFLKIIWQQRCSWPMLLPDLFYAVTVHIFVTWLKQCTPFHIFECLSLHLFFSFQDFHCTNLDLLLIEYEWPIQISTPVNFLDLNFSSIGCHLTLSPNRRDWTILRPL